MTAKGHVVLAALPAFISGIFRDLGISHRGFTHFAIIPVTLMLLGYILDIDILVWLGAGVFMFWYPLLPNKTFGLLPRKYRFYTFSLTEKVVILVLFALNLILITRGWLYG